MQRPVSQIIGKLGLIEEPNEFKGQWAFSIWVLPIDSLHDDSMEPDNGPFGPYRTETEAREWMQKALKVCQECIERDFGVDCSVRYVEPLSQTRH